MSTTAALEKELNEAHAAAVASDEAATRSKAEARAARTGGKQRDHADALARKRFHEDNAKDLRDRIAELGPLIARARKADKISAAEAAELGARQAQRVAHAKLAELIGLLQGIVPELRKATGDLADSMSMAAQSVLTRVEAGQLRLSGGEPEVDAEAGVRVMTFAWTMNGTHPARAIVSELCRQMLESVGVRDVLDRYPDAELPSLLDVERRMEQFVRGAKPYASVKHVPWGLPEKAVDAHASRLPLDIHQAIVNDPAWNVDAVSRGAANKGRA